MRGLKEMLAGGLSLGRLAFALITLNVPTVAAQSGQGDPGKHVAEAENAPKTVATALIRGKAFSATRYARTVRILPSGKEQFIQNERYPSRIARDAEGRIYLHSIHPQAECDRPKSQMPPICPSWRVLVFDPAAQAITHGPEGEMAAHIAVVLRMSAAPLSEAENSTSSDRRKSRTWAQTEPR